MSQSKVINTNHFPLDVPNDPKGRWWHLCTLHRGVREYMHFVDMESGQTYLEEITGGHLEKIPDGDEGDRLVDELMQAMASYAPQFHERMQMWISATRTRLGYGSKPIELDEASQKHVKETDVLQWSNKLAREAGFGSFKEALDWKKKQRQG